MLKKNKSNSGRKRMKEKEFKIREKTKVARSMSNVRPGFCSSASQPCKEVGLTADEVQKVWFGGGGKDPDLESRKDHFWEYALLGKYICQNGKKVGENHRMHVRELMRKRKREAMLL